MLATFHQLIGIAAFSQAVIVSMRSAIVTPTQPMNPFIDSISAAIWRLNSLMRFSSSAFCGVMAVMLNAPGLALLPLHDASRHAKLKGADGVGLHDHLQPELLRDLAGSKYPSTERIASPVTRMKSAPWSLTDLPVGGRPVIDPVFVPHTTHCAAASRPARPTLAISNDTSGKRGEQPLHVAGERVAADRAAGRRVGVGALRGPSSPAPPRDRDDSTRRSNAVRLQLCGSALCSPTGRRPRPPSRRRGPR